MKIALLTLLLGLSVIFSGCGIKVKTDKKTDELIQQGKDKVSDVIDKGKDAVSDEIKKRSREVVNKIAEGLKKEAKSQIDMWLTEKNLNEFGDPYGTKYVDGTPLMDKISGDVVDKYEYLLNKFPELIDMFNLE